MSGKKQFWGHVQAVNLTLLFGVDQTGRWSTDTSGGHSIQRNVIPHTCSQTWNKTAKPNTLTVDSALFDKHSTLMIYLGFSCIKSIISFKTSTVFKMSKILSTLVQFTNCPQEATVCLPDELTVTWFTNVTDTANIKFEAAPSLISLWVCVCVYVYVCVCWCVCVCVTGCTNKT